MGKVFALTAVAALAACSQAPEAITPANVGGAYDHLSCADARAMRVQEGQQLEALSQAQRNRRTAEGVSIVLFGVFGAAANAMIGGDDAGNISVSKGKVVALDARLVRCP